MIKTFILKIRGKVQNVGFRYWFFQEAVNLNLNGYVKNLDNINEVESLVQGESKNIPAATFIKFFSNDQDILFFFRLIFGISNENIVSGLYLRQPPGGTMNSIPVEYACLSKSDKSLWTNEVNGEMIEVFGNGMGWMLVKKGVFEKTHITWFGPIIEGLDFNGEDVAFQMRAKDVGFPSYVDTSIVVGHEKGVVLK